MATARRPKVAPKRVDGRTLRRRSTSAPRAKGARWQHILDAAALLMQQRGFAGTTIEDVAQQLQLTKAAFYYYVGNKEELLYEISSQTLAVAVERIGAIERSSAAPEEKVERVVDTFVRLVADRPEFFAVYFQEKGHLAPGHLRAVTRTERRIVDAVRRIYEQGRAKGSFGRLDPTAAAFGLLGLCFWVYKWYRPGGRLSVDEVVRSFQGLALEGYRAGRRRA